MTKLPVFCKESAIVLVSQQSIYIYNMSGLFELNVPIPLKDAALITNLLGMPDSDIVMDLDKFFKIEMMDDSEIEDIKWDKSSNEILIRIASMEVLVKITMDHEVVVTEVENPGDDSEMRLLIQSFASEVLKSEYFRGFEKSNSSMARLKENFDQPIQIHKKLTELYERLQYITERELHSCVCDYVTKEKEANKGTDEESVAVLGVSSRIDIDEVASVIERMICFNSHLCSDVASYFVKPYMIEPLFEPLTSIITKYIVVQFFEIVAEMKLLDNSEQVHSMEDIFTSEVSETIRNKLKKALLPKVRLFADCARASLNPDYNKECGKLIETYSLCMDAKHDIETLIGQMSDLINQPNCVIKVGKQKDFIFYQGELICKDQETKSFLKKSYDKSELVGMIIALYAIDDLAVKVFHNATVIIKPHCLSVEYLDHNFFYCKYASLLNENISIAGLVTSKYVENSET